MVQEITITPPDGSLAVLPAARGGDENAETTANNTRFAIVFMNSLLYFRMLRIPGSAPSEVFRDEGLPDAMTLTDSEYRNILSKHEGL